MTMIPSLSYSGKPFPSHLYSYKAFDRAGNLLAEGFAKVPPDWTRAAVRSAIKKASPLFGEVNTQWAPVAELGTPQIDYDFTTPKQPTPSFHLRVLARNFPRA